MGEADRKKISTYEFRKKHHNPWTALPETLNSFHLNRTELQLAIEEVTTPLKLEIEGLKKNSLQLKLNQS